jgi:hypothetical protein
MSRCSSLSCPPRRWPLADTILLAASFLCAVCGMGWLALAMDVHWSQVRSAAAHSAAAARRLRSFGATALVLSLLACFAADHASMAALVWVMTVSASAFAVAMTLAYRPRWLSWLAAVSGSRSA